MPKFSAKIAILMILTLLLGTFSFVFSAKADPVEPLNITVLNVTPYSNSALIHWSTNSQTRGRISFGTSQNLGSWVENNNLDFNHDTTLSGLQINQKYYFQIQVFDTDGRVYTSSILNFTTLNQDPNPPQISNIQSTYITGNTITFAFETNKPAQGCVFIGLDQSHLNNGGCDGGNTMIHEVTIRSLSNNTLYTYRAYAKDSFNNETYSVYYSARTTFTNDTNLPSLSIRLSNEQPQIVDVNSVNIILSFQANRPVEGRLAWGEQTGSYNHEIRFPTPRTTDLNLTIINLEYYKKYYYILDAQDIFGNHLTTLEQVIFTPASNYNSSNSSIYDNLDPNQDSDMDGLTNGQEKIYGTNPFKADTDGDGFLDGEEVANGYNPLGQGKLVKPNNSNGYAYQKPRLKDLQKEQQLAVSLKNQLNSKFNGKLPVAASDWATLVKAYVYGGYPVQAIYQAIIHKGKTVHPTIPWSSWKNTPDYKYYILT